MKLRNVFLDMPIGQKLRSIILGISWSAILGSCAGILVYQWFAARTDLNRILKVTAEVLADQCSVAVEFLQPDKTEAILRSLKADHQIVHAAVYTPDGKLFASYAREDMPTKSIPGRSGLQEVTSEQGDLIVFQPIQSEAETLGTLALRSDMSVAWQRLWTSFWTVCALLLIVGSVVFVLSKKLGRLISDPIQLLAHAVHKVSTTTDYTIRVKSKGRDELGRLIDGFNDMLSQIRDRDSALARARDELEQRVIERTRALEQEVTEHRATGKLLQENDHRLKDALQIAKLGSWEWNLPANQVSWSDELYRIYGREHGTFTGGIEEFVESAVPEDRATLRESLSGASKSAKAFVLEFRVNLPDGSVRYLQGKGKPVLDAAEQPLRLVGTLQDVTERQVADQAIRKLNRTLEARMADLAAVNKELEAFTYSVSHDLRAPLRAIGGYSKMFLEDFPDKLTPEGQRYLDVIVDNTVKMGQLIDDLLAFSRLGRTALKVMPIDIEGMARGVLAELQAGATDRDIEVRIEPLPRAVGDAAMVKQVLINLLSNAVKYTRKRKKAVIEIGVTSSPGAPTYFVKDNGVGFDMTYAHKLFGVFQRLHSVAEFEGTGVGLALVQRIVQKHGGKVWGEGKLDVGATFYFTLGSSVEEEIPLKQAAPAMESSLA